MKFEKGAAVLSIGTGYSPSMGEYSSYTDVDGNKVYVPNELIIHLYSLLQWYAGDAFAAFEQQIEAKAILRKEKQ